MGILIVIGLVAGWLYYAVGRGGLFGNIAVGLIRPSSASFCSKS